VLSQVALAESGLHRLGFAAVRVRHYGELARVELPVEDLARALDRRQLVVEAVLGAGYRYVTLVRPRRAAIREPQQGQRRSRSA
jgi:uncharacterized protein